MHHTSLIVCEILCFLKKKILEFIKTYPKYVKKYLLIKIIVLTKKIHQRNQILMREKKKQDKLEKS